MVWKGRAARPRSIPLPTVARTACELGTSKYLCCVSGSMKLATRSAAVAPGGANRGFSSLTVRSRAAVCRALIRVPSQGFRLVSLGRPPTSSGGGTGPKRPGPEHGTTGTLTVSTHYIRPGVPTGKGSFAVRPQWRGEYANTQFPLTETPPNGLKKRVIKGPDS